MELEGRVALVTGAGSGIGLATAQALAREGAIVIINDIRMDAAEAAAKSLGEQHLAVGGDVADERSVSDMIMRVIQHYGRIDIAVNNAGIGDNLVPTVNQTLEHWTRLINVNLTGTFLVCKAVAPFMIERGSGVILNVSSVAGVLGLSVRTAYSAAKAGVSMLTRVLGCEWGPYGIRVNAVAPGYMLTPLSEKMIAEGKIDEKRIRRRTPMGRLGTGHDIAEAMVFLASDKARFITGIVLPVDGGYCAWAAPSDAYPVD